MMAEKGILVVVSGFSGAGKGTLIKKLMEKYDNYALSISATTRNPRPGEEHGREYFFHTKKEFEELILQDALIEYAQYVDNYYGTPKSFVREALKEKSVILEIDVVGALNAKKAFPECVLVMVLPPSVEELKKRLEGRHSETEEEIKTRLARIGARKGHNNVENFRTRWIPMEERYLAAFGIEERADLIIDTGR